MTQEFNENIQTAKLADALSERYLAYAMSTIVSRSLPDVRDGLNRCTEDCFMPCVI